MELARCLQARVDKKFAAHIQVVTEGENQAATVLQDVVELRIEVRAQQDLIAVPCFDS